MAALTLMAATSTIDGGPEARTIHHRIFYNVQNTNHLLLVVLVTLVHLVFLEQLLISIIDMGNAVIQLRQFAAVPAICGSYEIARDALQTVYVMTMAARAFLQILRSILVAAVHATVAIMIHRAVTHVQAVHHIHHTHYHLYA